MKRAIVDGWDTDKALEEATALGLTNETLKQFFLAQIQAAQALIAHRGQACGAADGSTSARRSSANSIATKDLRHALSLLIFLVLQPVP